MGVITIRPDYYQGTCYFAYESELSCFLNLVCDLLPMGDSYGFLGRSLFCGEQFTNSFRSIRGKLYGGYRYDSRTHNYKILLQIPGSYWSQLDPDKYTSLLDLCLLSGFNTTRFDICLDDYSRRVSFDEVKQFGSLGNYRLVSYYECIESTIVRGQSPIPTCNFGKGHKRLRFYNAEFVHGIPADRWELQLRDNHAKSAVKDYLELPDCLGEFITGSVDFGMESSGYWASFSRADWWESFHQDIQGSRKPELSPSKSSFDRAVRWLYAQVAPTLAVAYGGYGQDRFNEFVLDLVDDGCKRLKPFHHEWINELKKEQ